VIVDLSPITPVVDVRSTTRWTECDVNSRRYPGEHSLMQASNR
jgi:hypothetical protein